MPGRKSLKTLGAENPTLGRRLSGYWANDNISQAAIGRPVVGQFEIEDGTLYA
jgi:hypothetical protein